MKKEIKFIERIATNHELGYYWRNDWIDEDHLIIGIKRAVLDHFDMACCGNCKHDLGDGDVCEICEVYTPERIEWQPNGATCTYLAEKILLILKGKD